MPTWPKNDWSPSDTLHADDLNDMANAFPVWKGNVNGGGFHLSNVIIDNYFPGAGAPLLSPIHVIPTSTDYTSQLRLDSEAAGNPARWILIKDATVEAGSNVGSDFTLTRCDDSGRSIDSPIAINRASGLITMGAQKWAGNVDANHFTLTNVVIPGAFIDPTTTKGDLIVRGAAALGRLGVAADGLVLVADSTKALGIAWSVSPAVPTNTQIIAGPGLSGGGPLTGNVTLSANVLSVFGKTGAVVMTPGDIIASGGVTTARQVIAGAGMSGGGSLVADVTLTALVTSVFGRTGNVVLTPGDVTAGGGVPSTTKVIAGAGMSGGGSLAADVTLNALVTSVFGRTGAVVLMGTDISGAGGVLATRRILAGTGLSGGGQLNADVTLAAAPDSTLQQVAVLNNAVLFGQRSALNFIPGTNVAISMADDPANNRMNITLNGAGVTAIWHNGNLVASRPAINFIDGSNVTITATDDSTNNRVNIQISAVGGTGGGGSQTPWTSPIDAAGNSLANVSLIGVNRSLDVTARIAVQTTGTELGIRVANALTTSSAVISVENDNATSRLMIQAFGSAYPSTSLRGTSGLNASVGSLTFSVISTEAMRIASSGRVLIGTVTDDGSHILQVNGAIKSVAGGIVFPDGSIQLTASAGGFIDPTSVKGDMIVHSASATTRLGVGTDGQILMASSADPLGVKWSASPSGQTPWLQDIIAGGFALKNVGAIGIGGNPLDPLTVNGAIRVFGPSVGTVAASSMVLDYISGFARIVAWGPNATTAGQIQFGTIRSDGTGGNVALAVLSGKVGVNTTTPNEALSVVGALRVSGTVTSSSPNSFVLDFGGGACRLLTYGPDASTSAPLFIYTGHGDGSGGILAMTVGPNGGVCIGPSTPLGPLDVIVSSQAASVAASGAFGLRLSTGVPVTSDTLLFGVHTGDYSWIQAVLPGTTTRALSLQPLGGGVGIGTTAPTGILDGVQGGAARVNVTFTNTTAVALNNRMRIRLGTQNGFLNTDLYPYVEAVNEATYTALAFGVYSPTGSAVEAVRIASSGFMGIGTTAPTTILSLGTTLAPIKLSIYDGGAASCYGLGIAGGILTFGAGINPTSGTPQMVLQSSGNVGIGTTAPTAQLMVYGANQATGNPDTVSGAMGGTLYLKDAGAAGGNGGMITFGAFQGNAFAAIKGYLQGGGNYSIGSLVFSVRNVDTSAALTNAMCISYQGLVGIGTLSPGAKLDVVGVTHLGGQTGILVDSVGGGGAAQLAITGATDQRKALWLSFDTTSNWGRIEAGISGVSWNALHLNPSGGNVGIGCGANAPPQPLSVVHPSAGMYIGNDVTNGYIITRDVTTGVLVHYGIQNGFSGYFFDATIAGARSRVLTLGVDGSIAMPRLGLTPPTAGSYKLYIDASGYVKVAT